MSYQHNYDKLGVINSSLAMTGDNLVNAADNGSDEWNTCSPAYELGLGYITESHSWGYAKVVNPNLPPSPTPPPDTQWDTAYPIPQDCVHIIWLKINDNTGDSPNYWTNMPVLYDIQSVNNVPCIVTNSQGGPPPPNPPLAPSIISLGYISNQGPLADSTNGTPMLILSLNMFVQSAIYGGLHEDTGERDKLWDKAEKMLQLARTRYDQQKPKRQFFNSRMYASRRIRRPWPPVGIGGWGGPGGPPG